MIFFITSSISVILALLSSRSATCCLTPSIFKFLSCSITLFWLASTLSYVSAISLSFYFSWIPNPPVSALPNLLAADGILGIRLSLSLDFTIFTIYSSYSFTLYWACYISSFIISPSTLNFNVFCISSIVFYCSSIEWRFSYSSWACFLWP